MWGSDYDRTMIAAGATRDGSIAPTGQFSADLESFQRANQRLELVEAYEERVSGKGEDLHLDRFPIVFGQQG
jgi:hypothetical protein